jgi:putative addiction module component (TIGR02574 family)
MEKQVETLLKEALTLCEVDRADMAGALLESLEPQSEDEVEEAWRREVAARVEALDNGETESIPWEKVRDQMWARLSENRSR